MPTREKKVRSGQWMLIDSQDAWTGFQAEVESTTVPGVSVVWPPAPPEPFCVKVDLRPQGNTLRPVACVLDRTDLEQIYLGAIEVCEVRGLLGGFWQEAR